MKMHSSISPVLEYLIREFTKAADLGVPGDLEADLLDHPQETAVIFRFFARSNSIKLGVFKEITTVIHEIA